MFKRKTNNITEKLARDNQLNNIGYSHAIEEQDSKVGVGEFLESTYGQGSFKLARYKRVCESFLDSKTPLKVLEVAAGLGDFSCLSRKLYPEHTYYINELSEKLVRDNLSSVASFFNVSGEFILGFFEAENIPYEDNSFDRVFIRASIHHFEDPKKVLTEIHRVLKHGGKLIAFNEPTCLSIPIYRSLYEYFATKKYRDMGFNEHVYTIGEYLNFGKVFREKGYSIDPVVYEDFVSHVKHWTGIKKIIANLIQAHSLFLKWFFTYRKRSYFIFTFSK